jgi:hypothetical protein
MRNFQRLDPSCDLSPRSGLSGRLHFFVVDRVSDCAITFQPTLAYSFQHRNPVIYIVINPNHSFVITKSVQPSQILLKGPLPGSMLMMWGMSTLLKPFSFIRPLTKQKLVPAAKSPPQPRAEYFGYLCFLLIACDITSSEVQLVTSRISLLVSSCFPRFSQLWFSATS